MSCLKDSEWKEYIRLIKEECFGVVEGDFFDVFEYCQNIELITKINDWTEKEIEIFIYGINNAEKYKGIRLHAKDSDGKPMVIDLEESIRRRKILKVIPNIIA